MEAMLILWREKEHKDEEVVKNLFNIYRSRSAPKKPSAAKQVCEATYPMSLLRHMSTCRWTHTGTVSGNLFLRIQNSGKHVKRSTWYILKNWCFGRGISFQLWGFVVSILVFRGCIHRHIPLHMNLEWITIIHQFLDFLKWRYRQRSTKPLKKVVMSHDMAILHPEKSTSPSSPIACITLCVPSCKKRAIGRQHDFVVASSMGGHFWMCSING